MSSRMSIRKLSGCLIYFSENSVKVEEYRSLLLFGLKPIREASR